jgi:hypothetical protein
MRPETGHAGVQHERRDDHALGVECRDHLARERATRRRHLGASRLAAEHGLVRGERPSITHVAVPNRRPVLGSIGENAARAREDGFPEPHAAARHGGRTSDAEWRHEGGASSTPKPDLLAGDRTEQRL